MKGSKYFKKRFQKDIDSISQLLWSIPKIEHNAIGKFTDFRPVGI